MASFSLINPDSEYVTLNVTGLQSSVQTSNYAAFGLSLQSFTQGQTTQPTGTFWTGDVGGDIPVSSSFGFTQSIEHGLAAGTYTVYGWAESASGNYWSLGSAVVTIPDVEPPTYTTYNYYGGYGGGAAYGRNGAAGSGSRSSQRGGTGATPMASGANAVYSGTGSSAQGYGNGGSGGHGGGGGGGGGYNTKTGGDSGGSGGSGTSGGSAAPGCALIYYGES